MDNSELEAFRQQWREEVSNRNKSRPQKATSAYNAPSTGQAHAPPRPPAPRRLSRDQRGSFDGTGSTGTSSTTTDAVPTNINSEDNVAERTPKEPTSALEHYEKAVEREAQGKLGDSLKHYRQAYKLDSAVDKTYKKKYFPGPFVPPKSSNNTTAEPGLPPSKTSSNNARTQSQASLTSISDLIDSFAALSIPAASSPSLSDADDTPPSTLPCPFGTLPSEVLLEILHHAAQIDMSTLGRLSQVCKRLAYLITREDRIWQHLVCGSQVGFGGMHYSSACDVIGRPLPDRTLNSLTPPTYLPVPLTPAYPTYRHTLHHRPRIRFNGCYISTVNYARPGAASASQISWNTPVHIITYYRYLRFFRDGTVISLVSTHEPVEIVHHLTKENLPFRCSDGGGGSAVVTPGLPSGSGSGQAQAGVTLSGGTGTGTGTGPLPSSVFQHAVRGRWRLSGCPVLGSFANDIEGRRKRKEHEEEHGCLRDSTITGDGGTPGEPYDPTTIDESKREREGEGEGETYIQTEGLDKTYLFAMHLALRSSSARSGGGSSVPGGGGQTGGTGGGGGTKNNKLIWKSFWSYNRVLDSWDEFRVGNDRPFWFSRVKSYGMGQ